MGVPYSKEAEQIAATFQQVTPLVDRTYAAFDQVTPLIAALLGVLRSTKYLFIFLAALHAFVIALLVVILFALLALLITMNPDLRKEREVFVTPVLRWGFDRLRVQRRSHSEKVR